MAKTYDIPTSTGYKTVAGGTRDQALTTVQDQGYKLNLNNPPSVSIAPVNTTPDASKIASITPINIPATNTNTTDAGISGATDTTMDSAKSAFDQYLTDKTARDTAAKASSGKNVSDAIRQLMGVQQSQTTEEANAKIPELAKLSNDTFTQIQASKRAQEKELLALEKNPNGLFGGALQQAEANINRKYAFEQADLAITYDVANRNLTSAQGMVDKKIALQIEPLKTALDYYEKFDQNNRDQLSRDEQNQLDKWKMDYKQAIDDKSAVGDVLKQVLASGQQIPANVLAELNSANNATDAYEILAKNGITTQDQLDRQYKQAQISKIYNDMSTSDVSGDPSQILAYAQQYASTGVIPTGLPKGTFGFVSQVAKELPKPNGTVVDNNTGIKSSKFSASQEDGVAALKDLVNKLDELKSMPRVGGPGTVTSYNALRGEIVDLIARARTGAAINDSEQKMYESKVPDANLFNLFPTVKINSLQSSLNNKLNTILTTNGVSMYGYSKVKVNGKEYVVGDIITNGLKPSDPGYRQGRVNPDGSVTIQ